MKTLYIHAGMAKTGSSALQQFFYNNRKKLNDINILYPNSGKISPNSLNHFRLYFCFREKQHFMCPENIKSIDDEWKKIIEEARETERDILISCEAFIKLSVDNFNAIKELVCDEYQVKIIIYIQRADEQIISLTNQKIKRENLQNKDVNVDHVVNRRLELYDKIIELVKVFGERNIIIRPYESEKFYKQNIIDDFLHNVFNIIDSNDYNRKNELINTSLGQDSIEYKLIVNQLGISILEARPISDALMKYAYDLNEKPPVILKYDERKKILDGLKEKEIWISNNLMNNSKDLIFENDLIDDSLDEKKYHVLSVSKTIEISKYIIKEIMLSKTEEEIDMTLNDIKDGAINQKNTEVEIIKHIIKKVSKIIISSSNSEERQSSEKSKKWLLNKLNINSNIDNVVFYKEIALFFEKHEQFKSAYYFMNKAKYYRRNGPFIVKKCEEYKKKLKI